MLGICQLLATVELLYKEHIQTPFFASNTEGLIPFLRGTLQQCIEEDQNPLFLATELPPPALTVKCWTDGE